MEQKICPRCNEGKLIPSSGTCRVYIGRHWANVKFDVERCDNCTQMFWPPNQVQETEQRAREIIAERRRLQAELRQLRQKR